MKEQLLLNTRDFFDFVRWGVAASLVFLAVSGYLLFNSLDIKILFVVLSSFFIACGAYGYNSITDKQ